LKFIHISYTQLQFGAHLANLSRWKVCKPQPSVLRQILTKLSTCGPRQMYHHSTFINTPQWSHIPRKMLEDTR